jgi:hypothetical protein
VIAKNIAMNWVGLMSRLNRKMKTATPRMEDRPPRVKVRVVRADECRQQGGAEQSEQAGGQNGRQRIRRAELVLERFRLFGRGCVDRRQGLLHGRRLLGEIGVPQQRVDGDRHDHRDHEQYAEPPAIQDIGHLGLVRVLRAALVALRSLPAVERVEDDHQRDDEVPDVEVLARVDPEGVGQRFALRHRQEHGRHVLPPEEPQQEDDRDDEDDVGERPLEEVGHHDGDLAAEKGEDEGRGQEADHERAERGDIHAADSECRRESAIGNEEPRAHGGVDPEVDDAGGVGHEPREHPEPAAVPHLEELGEGHRPRLAKAVDDPARQGNDDEGRLGHRAPPHPRKADLVVQLEPVDERDQARARHGIGGGDDVPAAAALGDKEAGDALRVAGGVDRGGREHMVVVAIATTVSAAP